MKKLCLALISAFFLSLFPGFATASAADFKFSMSYIYFGDSTCYTALVQKAQRSLSEVAPNYFTLDGGGNLVLTNAVSRAFVESMQAEGIRVAPFLTNDWSNTVGVNALCNRDALSTSLANAVSAYALDGINIDLENLDQNQRQDYVDFVRLLREKLPAGKTIAVAVAANPNGLVTGWQGSYDYAGLSNYADYLMLMAYDEHYYGSAPGPVSSMTFLEKSVQYALGCAPKEKLVLGLPFYGRIWSQNGGYPQGYGISDTKITALLSAYQNTVTVDSASRSARADITIKSCDARPTVGGTALTPGTYVIWYENAQTLKEKLGLVTKYGLKGVGSWSLGQEDAGTWDYYTRVLNGCSFGDIDRSWARSYILDAFMNGWVNGTSPCTYSPGAPLTRAEAAAMLVRLLGYPIEKDQSLSFDDTKGTWAEDAVVTARVHGIVSGVGGNLFDPDKPVTRQEMAVMLNNIQGASASVPATGLSVTYADVSTQSNPWSFGAIAALSAGGVFTGFPDGSFRPFTCLTRDEMAALLVRIHKAPAQTG